MSAPRQSVALELLQIAKAYFRDEPRVATDVSRRVDDLFYSAMGSFSQPIFLDKWKRAFLVPRTGVDYLNMWRDIVIDLGWDILELTSRERTELGIDVQVVVPSEEGLRAFHAELKEVRNILRRNPIAQFWLMTFFLWASAEGMRQQFGSSSINPSPQEQQPQQSEWLPDVNASLLAVLRPLFATNTDPLTQTSTAGVGGQPDHDTDTADLLRQLEMLVGPEVLDATRAVGNYEWGVDDQDGGALAAAQAALVRVQRMHPNDPSLSRAAEQYESSLSL